VRAAPPRRASDVEPLRRGYLAELRRSARLGAAAELRRYLGSPLPVLALPVPEFRRHLRAFDRALGPLPAPDLRRLLVRFWRGRTYEERLTAIELLDRHTEMWHGATWDLLDRWVDEATGWALSDSLASGPVAGWIAAEPDRFDRVLDWTGSPHSWRRRAATYALRDWVRSGDLERPLELLERLLDDREFWVQRAVGTWLRECWKKDAERTERFLRRHLARLAPVTLTVATERAPTELRASLRRTRAEARAARAARADDVPRAPSRRAGRPKRG